MRMSSIKHRLGSKWILMKYIWLMRLDMWKFRFTMKRLMLKGWYHHKLFMVMIDLNHYWWKVKHFIR